LIYSPLVSSSSFISIRYPHKPTLFPYTTLFRSYGKNTEGHTNSAGRQYIGIGCPLLHFIKKHGFCNPCFFMNQWNHRRPAVPCRDRKSTRLNSSHVSISYAVFCLKKKKNTNSIY